MQIIHTGDIHIGSAFVGLPKDKANLRKAEIIDGFKKLCAFAKETGVQAVLIAGDLFDENDVPKQLKNEVLSLIGGAAPVRFFYVFGNHDGAVSLGESLPENFHTFSSASGFTSYRLDENVVVTGADAHNFSRAFSSPLQLDAQAFNILLLHGETCMGEPKNTGEIPLSYLQNKNVDYLALGHIHRPDLQALQLDFRGRYRYCGCLEGRGYDEVGDRGFFLLTVENRKIVDERFLTFAARKIIEIRVDVADCQTHFDIERKIADGVRGVSKEMLVKIVLCGKYRSGLRKDVAVLSAGLQDKFFYAKIEDESRLYVDPKAYENDLTERGEFVREVGRYAMNEDFRAEVLEIGLQALNGEEIAL